MRILLNMFDVDEHDAQNLERIKSKRQHRLTGRQSVNPLVSDTESVSDPDSKSMNSELNAPSRVDFLDKLSSGINTGKEASARLCRSFRKQGVAVDEGNISREVRAG